MSRRGLPDAYPWQSQPEPYQPSPLVLGLLLVVFALLLWIGPDAGRKAAPAQPPAKGTVRR